MLVWPPLSCMYTSLTVQLAHDAFRLDTGARLLKWYLEASSQTSQRLMEGEA